MQNLDLMVGLSFGELFDLLFDFVFFKSTGFSEIFLIEFMDSHVENWQN